MTQPNILFIMVDQLAANALPFYGHPTVKTPHLNRLAAQSVVFDNAYCNSPLCAPSRFSMMSGQLPSHIGAYDNAANFPADVPTIAHYLRALGYQTCLTGKMHFVGPDQLHGFEERRTTDIYPSDYGWTPDWTTFAKRPSWYHNMLSVVQAGTCQSSNQLDFDEEVAFQGVRKLYDLARSEDKRPFFQLVSFTHPHDPFAITPEYWNRYRHDEIDLPTIPQIPYDQLDPHSQRLHHVCALSEYAQTEARIRNARHAYYGMISYIDDKVGQLLHALEVNNLADNSIIIFTADHGEMLGERGLWFKMSFFEWSARVPLLIYAPKQFTPRRVSHNVSLVDLLPTLAALGNNNQPFPPAAPLDGHSLLPLLHGDDSQAADVALGEMLAEGAIAPNVMIKRGQYKYIYSRPDPEQLYDVVADPQEQTNLARSPDHASLLTRFRAERADYWQLDQLHRDILASQQRRRLVDRALALGSHTAWDFQPRQDASKRFMRNHLDLNVLERTSRFPSPAVPPPDGG